MDEEQNENEEIFAEVPAIEDLGDVEDDALASLIEDYETQIQAVGAKPTDFLSADLSKDDLMEAMRSALETLRALKAEQASRALSAEDEAAFAELAAETTEPAPEPEPEPEDEPEVEAAAEETVTAALAPAPSGRRLPKPAGDHELVETEPTTPRQIGFVAAGGVTDMTPGQVFHDELEIADAVLAIFFSLANTFSLPGITTRSVWKLFLMSTPSVFFGRSFTWPSDASTSYSLPRYLLMVLAFAGDSTMTNDFANCVLGLPWIL